MYSQAPGASDARSRAITELERKSDALEGRLSARTAQLTRTPAAVSLDAVQGAIPRDAVLIEFFRYRPFDPHVTKIVERFGPPKYAAFALRRTGGPVWLELGDAAQIDTRVDELRGSLQNPRRKDVRERAEALRTLLTAPLEALAGTAEQVLLAPDGNLNLLPFQALTGVDGRFLIERYRFTYLTSGRDVVMRTSDVKATRSMVIGNPAFGRATAASRRSVSRTFVRLPGADREAREVANLVEGALVLRGRDASERNLKAAQSPSVLHIATHGFFLAATGQDAIVGLRGIRPAGSTALASIPPLLRSGLALAGANTSTPTDSEDGILTASEAAMLDLRGTALVFLSACESGLGVVNAGESVYGLRRAFVIAGAQSQVLTLWQVSDDATRHFVVKFYQKVAKGASRSAALQDAQREALANPNRRHPFYWAAFIFSGRDDAVPVTTANRGERE